MESLYSQALESWPTSDDLLLAYASWLENNNQHEHATTIRCSLDTNQPGKAVVAAKLRK